MSYLDFSRLSLNPSELEQIDNGYTAEKAQKERDDSKNLFLTPKDVFSEIEKFVSDINPGLIDDLKRRSKLKPQPPNYDYLDRIDALLENTLNNDSHSLDPDWGDLLPRGSDAKPMDDKRFDIGIGQYQFTIRHHRRVDVNKVKSLSKIIKLRRKLGYVMNKRSLISQERTASFVEPTKKRPLRTEIEWIPSFHLSVINSLLDESVRNSPSIIFHELTCYTG